MNKFPVLRKIIIIGGSVVIVLIAYASLARPYQLHRGATSEEVQRTVPGDELLLKPKYLATRAITIQASPEKIWPWIIQMGFKRAGFYGYDILENLGSPGGIKSAERIVPELQNPMVGDDLPISLAGSLKFHAIEPNRYVIWSGKSANGAYSYVYTWALYPINDYQTRLVSRARFTYSWSNVKQLPFDLLTEFMEHLAIPEILQGVKGRVEGSIVPMTITNLKVAYYLATIGIYAWVLGLTLIRPLTYRGILTCIIAGLVWLVAWYAPIELWVGALLEIPVLWLLLGNRNDFHKRLGNGFT